MSKNNIIIALVVLCLVGTIWGSVQDKKSTSLERQLAAMKEQALPAEIATPGGMATGKHATITVGQDELGAAYEKVEELESQNEKLLAGTAILKGTVTSQKQQIADLEIAIENDDALAVLQAELDKNHAEVVQLQAEAADVRGELNEAFSALATAEKNTSDFEEVQASLANSVDVYSAKSQALSVELDEAMLRIRSLEQVLEERTKLLVAGEEELQRSRLNMNVLLSKIAAQNNSLAILEETRIVLEEELADKILLIEEMQAAEAVIEDVIDAENALAH